MARMNRVRAVAVILMLLSAAILLTAGCTHRDPPVVVKLASDERSEFVGNLACAECHASEFKAHHGSRHDRSLQAATRAELGSLTPAMGVVPLAGYAMAERSGVLTLERQGLEAGKVERQPLQLVLGSGKLGMTFVTLVDDNTLMETRMSFFPPYKLWDLTPGQEIKVPGDAPFGRAHSGQEAHNCLGCHATTVPSRLLQLAPRFYGVGCEACHGAGAAHIEAMRAKKYSEPHMANLAAETPTQINDLCGKCHRTARDVDLQSPEVNLTHRFQPYALQRSACRTKSDEPLSCLNCHNAHADVSTDLKAYEKACLNCHAALGAAAPTRVDPTSRQARVCPVNKISGCVGCHMRPKPAFTLTTIPAKMADHLISIEKK